MCPDSLNWTLWVRFHGRYWYQSFVDGSNIWGVDRTDPWGPEMDHPPLDRSYLVVESSCYMAMLIVTWEISSSAAAKYELYILLPADQCCSKKCVAALQADTFVYLYIYIYIYIWCRFSSEATGGLGGQKNGGPFKYWRTTSVERNWKYLCENEAQQVAYTSLYIYIYPCIYNIYIHRKLPVHTVHTRLYIYIFCILNLLLFIAGHQLSLL